MYWDSLIRIKNATQRNAERVKVPYSRFDFAVLELLAKKGYIESATRKGKGLKRVVDIVLKYGEDGAPAISGMRFISRPSRRVYKGYKDIRKSRQGYGHFVLSTPSGVFTEDDARKNKVGGQILFEIW